MSERGTKPLVTVEQLAEEAPQIARVAHAVSGQCGPVFGAWFALARVWRVT